ncbi:MAG: hypothetical protein ACM3O7_10535 [Acidobacteriota bacterium]
MWRLVREELRFAWPIVLVSWAFGIGIFLLVIVLLKLVGSTADRAEVVKIARQMPIAILIASMVAGFIFTGTARSESRVRMFIMLPLAIRSVAAARVVVPAMLMLLGLALSHVVFTATLALGGDPLGSARQLNVDAMGLQMLFWLQFALIVREVIELDRSGRRGAAAVWTVAVMATVGVVVWFLIGALEGTATGVGAMAALDAALMAATAALFSRRRDFTK